MNRVLKIICFLFVFLLGIIQASLDGYCHTMKDLSMAFQDWCENGQQVHGLWPNPDCNCDNDEAFDLYSIDSETRSLMNENWNACDQSNIALWTHEWEKHGKCSGLTQAEYFSVAIKLFLKLKGQCKGTCKIQVSSAYVQAALNEKYEGKEYEDRSEIYMKIFETFFIFAVLSLFGIIDKSFFAVFQDSALNQIKKTNRGGGREMEIALPLMNNDDRNIEESVSV